MRDADGIPRNDLQIKTTDGSVIRPLAWSLSKCNTSGGAKGISIQSLGQRILPRIPLFGGLFEPRDHVRDKYILSTAEQVNSLLQLRPETVVIGTTEEREVANWLADTIQDSIGWTNDRYILDDHLELLLLSWRDGLDAEHFRFCLEDYVNKKLPNSERLISDYTTFGSLLSWICDHRRANKRDILR